jgi:hypothetical protein
MTFDSPTRATSPERRTFVVPASVLSLSPQYFSNPDTIEAVIFAPDSQFSTLESDAFGSLTLLKSIFIPASVEPIAGFCFADPVDEFHSCSLETLTFAEGSKLRRIEAFAFVGCHSLKSICLPASVEEIGSGAFSESGIRDVQLESRNFSFRVRDCFLMDFAEISILYYFGADSNVTIPDYIEVVGQRCFSDSEDVSDVTFGSLSKVSSLGSAAFAACVSLRSFDIPASVTSIGPVCFLFCENLTEVRFGPGSKLSRIGERAFAYCLGLKSIVIPSSAQVLAPLYLLYCHSLENVTILPDSQLVRFEESVFCECKLLRSLFIPASVEYIGVRCFEKCNSLSTLMFGLPSRLESLLDIPPHWVGFHEISDGVKHLGLRPDWPSGPSECVLTFGMDSKLETIGSSSRKILPSCRSFVQISSRSLKRIRSHLEFVGSNVSPHAIPRRPVTLSTSNE